MPDRIALHRYEARGTEEKMILCLWRGWVTPENADRYEELIRQTIFPGILARTIAGLEGLELFRRPIEGEVEFMTLMRFASWDAVKAFAGANWETSVVPPAARAVLARFDEKAAHYERGVTQEGSPDDAGDM
jgi:antibiotic biosynthesis monooxygenase (ABM) superfamily enzyme